MSFLIDLDKTDSIPILKGISSPIDIKMHGKIVVKNSVLENIDSLKLTELEFLLLNFKDYIDNVVTSSYIPSAEMMALIARIAPDKKVRFKTARPGCDPIIPISAADFFEGEKIFDEILHGIDAGWTDIEKFKYIYNCTGLIFSYDLNAATYDFGNSEHEKYARNIFTAVTKNFAICTTFAACCDYLCYKAGLESEIISESDHDYLVFTTADSMDFLGDPTFDATALKFGLKPSNFAVSKEQFKTNHNLDETETEEYEFVSLSTPAIEEIDRKIGYLSYFGGTYTDDFIYHLASDLSAENILKSAETFIDRICSLKAIGRPGVQDYASLINRVLSTSQNEDFKNSIVAFPFLDERQNLKLGIRVTQRENTELYVFEDDFQAVKKADEKTVIKKF